MVGKATTVQSEIDIKGSNIGLHKMSQTLISDSYIGWLNDKELMRFSEQSRKLHTKESCLQYLKGFEGSCNCFWSIHSLSDDKQIGTMTAYIDEESQVADIGILIGDYSARGTGFGKEAFGLAIYYLFNVRNLRKVTGGTVEQNVAMIKIFEHHKMTREGTLRKQQLLNDQPFDIIRYGILKEEWLSNKDLMSSPDVG